MKRQATKRIDPAVRYSRSGFWTLHEKRGKSAWKIATWFTPVVYDQRNLNGQDPEGYVRKMARLMTNRHYQYKAVHYVRARRRP